MSNAILLMALAMGLTGSLHCAGMCGPIIWVMPFQQYKGVMHGIGIALYHFSRISTYALLGLTVHFFRDMFHPQWQQYFSVVAGVILLLIGLLYFLPQLGIRFTLPWTGTVTKLLGKALQQRHPLWLMATGALNGLLPCGMVYMAMAAAVSVPHSWQAVLVMYAFGAGTLPMMVSLTLLRGRISISLPGIRRWTPIILLLFGTLFILRGANMGIPFLSPKAITQKHEVKLDCCHRAQPNAAHYGEAF